MSTIKTLLIANRGEIAERIRRTAAEMGIRTVAIYSDADADMPIVTRADMAVPLGGVSPAESYLDMDKVLDAAKQTGADAIHPGYGFLSENAEFARRVAKAGLIFIGPSPEAIDAMGDKARAKRAMIKAGVPCIPGFQEDNATYKQLLGAASDIGFPLMVKAAAGGGGRGMRRVDALADLADAVTSARSEAENAFGSGELIMEKLVENARHVEVQVFGDTHGHVIHLGERDCSVQRRHQKVIEEAPCPAVDEPLRAKMGEAAVRAAQAVNYVGAGTVEFLLAENGEFYFLEMNTRLQVEHPVTEMITGLDLVALQIRVAQGEPLGLDQDDIELNGHAIEVRLYAEDPANGFLPQAGTITNFLSLTAARTDTGLEQDPYGETHHDIPSAYDPMIAKIITHAPSRNEAIIKMKEALVRTLVAGIPTNRDFLLQVLRTDTFEGGDVTTNWLDDEGVIPRQVEPEAVDFYGAIIQKHFHQNDEIVHNHFSISRELRRWSNWNGLLARYSFACGDEVKTVSIRSFPEDNRYEIIDGEKVISASKPRHTVGHSQWTIGEELWSTCYGFPIANPMTLATPRGTFIFHDISFGEPLEADGAGSGILRAPMHGLLLSVDVKEGDTVSEGDKLGTLEAMKMQHPLRADVTGVVKTISATPNTQLASGDLILEIESEDN